ncbi:hypothetical protein MPSEU_000372100 [Mayamaea pseudoterrestris]|nr:hypothetical protein MPSEU_000372100 [Mayamaea pseudoterrestris]
MNNPLSPARFRSCSSLQSPIKACPRSPVSFSSPLRLLQWPGISSLPPSPMKVGERATARASLSVGQALALAALCASVAVIVATALSSVLFSDTLYDFDYALSTRSLLMNTHGTSSSLLNLTLAAYTKTTLELAATGKTFMNNDSFANSTVTSHGWPMIALLMSFPNSGTSFTIHMTREASNTTTATNYALEGDIRNKPSVPVYKGSIGSQGPWLELISNREMSIPPRYILTKTHCKGFCSGRVCGADKTIQTVRSFAIGCLSGTRAIETNRGLEKVEITYDAKLVGKAIHIFRHPLDNIVARFHLEYNVQRARGNTAFTDAFTKDENGFKRWCRLEDTNRSLLAHRLIDKRLRQVMAAIPCFNDFYRYIQWHNLAFSVSHDLNLPTMILHYDNYSKDFEATRDNLLNWLELPRVANGVKFHDGKVYRSYYTLEEKQAIHAFIREFSSAETWKHLINYDFESNDAPAPNVTVELSAVL